jgi:hypothetical protein
VSLREGSCATYIGLPGPVSVGDRCLILADEGQYANVRWVSGVKTGSYDTVSTRDIVIDRKTRVSAFDDDEFGFEPETPKVVRVATAMVHANGGPDALMRALEHDGVLVMPRRLARQAVAEFKASLLGDRSWGEVVSELGADGDGFLHHAMQELMRSALNEGDADVPEEE